jgi:NAD(P)-dependent dehydrogenase (short-subunit alcohol dehydrogenase family)
MSRPAVPAASSRVARPVAVITGGARGIGLETARRLAPTHRVALLDRDAPGVERAAGAIGGDAVYAVCDITDATSVTSAVADVVDRCGGIDVAIANAGIATAGSLRHLDPDVLALQLDVNLTGNWRFLHACLPHVIERRGYVLGVASAAAIVAPVGLGAYAASKAGFEQLLNVLRVEVAHLGVDVGVAYFSFIDTDMVRGADARHPAFAAVRARTRGPVGQTLPVGVAGRAIADAVAGRKRTVVAPGFVRAAFWLRGLIGPLVDRESRQNAKTIDRATAEMVAERGAFEAGLQPRNEASAARSR